MEPTADVSVPKQKSKFGLILGLSIGGGLLLIGAVLLTLFLTVWSGPSQQEYRDAQAQAEKVTQSFETWDAVFSSLGLEGVLDGSTTITQTQLDAAKVEMQKFQNELKTSVDDLGSMSAIKNGDKKTKDLFETLKNAHNVYDRSFTVRIQVLDQVGLALFEMVGLVLTMGDLSDIPDMSVSELTAFTSSLTKVSQVFSALETDDSTINDAFHQLGTGLSCLSAAFTSGDLSKVTECLSQMESTSNLTDPFGAVPSQNDLTNAINNLNKHLTDKAGK
ncbi:hypothetical protein FWH58_00755 [Candidatus Saccharibacteria bacterium]|nr:hypothetical protein [Candidatus Saccharibacteria bacterium]